MFALHEEWRRHAKEYERVLAQVQTPFTAAAERERAWALYAARLDRQLDKPIFSEAFGLRQIYVPLRAFYLTGEERSAAFLLAASEGGEPPKKVAVELEAEIDAWLASGDRADCLRVLSGGPGTGKSSFAKVYAARAVSRRRRVLYVSLHQFNVAASLVSAVGEFVRMAEILPTNPLDAETGEAELLLIFDGLDELSSQGGLAAETARDFVREVQRTVEIRNSQARRLLVLITGREPVVQANVSELRNWRQVLHVLSYHVPKEEQTEDLWAGGRELLAADQRDDWWRHYGRVVGKDYQQLPSKLARPDLEEITAQPLLNYLVALSFGRGELDLRGEVNLNDIYEDLLLGVYGRAYEQPHIATRGMEFAEFKRILEEIALSAWHGNGRTTTVEEIEAHCASAGLSRLLERYAEGAKVGVSSVLTAFFFRQFGHTPTGERTFEFTHKSFREYLTALRIIRAMGTIACETERRSQDYDAGWDDRLALQHWAEICGPEAMDLDLFRFVKNEVRKRPADAVLWQRILCRLIAFMLRQGMPMELLQPRLSYRMETLRARNAEEALLAMLNACALTTKVVSEIDWPGQGDGATLAADQNVTAGTWIGRLRGQRSQAADVLTLSCLSFLKLSGCTLPMIDLVGADLANSELSGAILNLACLQSANLKGANLEEASLQGANLGWANLKGASLRGAHLHWANFEHANLEKANLEGAILRRVNFKKALLGGANLRKAYLKSANLVGANLRGANLGEADLGEAILERADLEGAKLEGAILKGAKGAKLEGAKLGGKPQGSGS